MARVRLNLCDHDTEKLDRIAAWLQRSKRETLRLLIRTFPLGLLAEDEFAAQGTLGEEHDGVAHLDAGSPVQDRANQEARGA